MKTILEKNFNAVSDDAVWQIMERDFILFTSNFYMSTKYFLKYNNTNYKAE